MNIVNDKIKVKVYGKSKTVEDFIAKNNAPEEHDLLWSHLIGDGEKHTTVDFHSEIAEDGVSVRAIIHEIVVRFSIEDMNGNVLGGDWVSFDASSYKIINEMVKGEIEEIEVDIANKEMTIQWSHQ